MSRNSCTFSECAGILGLVDHGAQSRYHQAHVKTERTSYFGCRLAVHADRGADGVGEFVGAGQEVAAGGRATRGATRGADCGAGRAIGASTGSRQRIATLGGNGDFAQETSQASFLGSFAGWSAGPPRPWAHALAGFFPSHLSLPLDDSIVVAPYGSSKLSPGELAIFSGGVWL
jgi:hypothetical protein